MFGNWAAVVPAKTNNCRHRKKLNAPGNVNEEPVMVAAPCATSIPRRKMRPAARIPPWQRISGLGVVVAVVGVGWG